jgi:hypothetical protein
MSPAGDSSTHTVSGWYYPALEVCYENRQDGSGGEEIVDSIETIVT